MAAARKAPKKRKRKAEEPEIIEDFDQAIYDGSRLLGNIIRRDGMITAETATEAPLGEFKTSNIAMQAILAADLEAKVGIAKTVTFDARQARPRRVHAKLRAVETTP